MFLYINRLHDILKDQGPFPLIRMPLVERRGDREFKQTEGSDAARPTLPITHKYSLTSYNGCC